MASYGKVLRQRREDLGATLEDAAQETRIRRRYLEALENEQPELLPDRRSFHGFLRAYARYLDLHPDVVLALAGVGTMRRDPAPFRLPASRALGARARVVLAVALAAALGLGGAGLYREYQEVRASLRSLDGLPPPTIVAAVTPRRPGLPGAMPPLVATPAEVLRVVARVHDRTHLQAWVDGRLELRRTVGGEEVFEFEGSESVRLRVSDAGAVEVVVNGELQGRLGAPGQAVEVRWSRT